MRVKSEKICLIWAYKVIRVVTKLAAKVTVDHVLASATAKTR
jgi:hypothetical protein